MALLCASLLNRGRTVFRGIAKIEEVNRILEVLTSIGVRATWSANGNDLELIGRGGWTWARWTSRPRAAPGR